MENHILQFVWRYSRREQIRVVLLTLLAFPLLYMTLEIPKWIINNALGDSQSMKSIFGVQLEPVPYLVALCVGLMLLVVLSGLLKMLINTYKGIIGERLIRRLRFSLIASLLRFPLHHYSSVAPGEMISTVSSETEPLAGYIGESIALPLFQGGTMLTILVFMFAQNWIFGVVSLVLIPVQGYLIPKIQKQINLLKKDRIRRVRKLSERIGETVVGASEIRLHGTEKYTLAEFSRRFGDLFWVRLEIFRKKYYMKFLNNTIGQITPFLYYLFGGYLVIKGSLTIGALVAAIAAYKDLTSPWRELLNHYQLHEDAKIKYQQIVAMFDVGGLLSEPDTEHSGPPGYLTEPMILSEVGWVDVHGRSVLSDVDLRIEPGSLISITGGGGFRRAKLAQLLSGLDRPTMGRVCFGDRPLQEIPANLLRTRVALQGPAPHIFGGSIAENLEYGLNQKQPFIEIEDSLSRDVVEAEASGNIHPLTTDWVDYRIASPDETVQNRDWYTRVIQAIGAERLIYERSLFEKLDPVDWPELAEKLLDARARIHQILSAEGGEGLVNRFAFDRFNRRATILENVLFGTLKANQLTPETLAHQTWLHRIFDQCGVLELAVDRGYQIARRLQTLKKDLSVDDDLLVHFGMQDLQFVEELEQAIDGYSSFARSRAKNHPVFLSLFLHLIPDSHPFAEFDESLEEALLGVRAALRSEIPEDIAGAIEPFDEDQYHSGLSVRDNLLFGRLRDQGQSTTRRIDALIGEVVDQVDIRTDLMILFGDSQAGVGGANLSVPERHTIALGRALMKRPDVMIFHDALSPFAETERLNLLKQIRKLLPEVTIVWIDQKPGDTRSFDHVYRLNERGGIENQTTQFSSNKLQPGDATASEAHIDPFSMISDAVLFSPLSLSQRRFLADHSTLVNFDRNAIVYERGDKADAVWLVVSGEVESRRGEQHVGTFRDREVFGSIEILAERDRMLTLQVTRASLLLRVEGSALERIAAGNAKVSRNLLRALTRQWGDEAAK